MAGDNDSVAAVQCINIKKHYGRGAHRLDVLQNLNMFVPQGSIYGLLGPSGCGKTTLLRCILGRLSMDHGTIWTLGKLPGTIGHGVPGSMVGYMPQETALYEDFTISETLNYFGTIHGMPRDVLQGRKEFLINLLDLPSMDSMIRNLSGGQKRRVSFAAALVQSPPLLILDEPTVGVDPLLRIRIWEHLLAFAKEWNTTIILTTHYIEEARQANIVGLMRNGKLLSESPPQDLIDCYQMPTLEDVFLKLCVQDSERRGDDEEQAQSTAVVVHSINGAVERNVSSSQEDVVFSSDSAMLIDESRHVCKPGPSKLRCSDIFLSPAHLWALMVKNIIRIMRNPGILFFTVVIPILQTSLFCLAVGNDPRDLSVAVANLDHPPILSKLYLQQIDNYTVHQIPVDTLSLGKAGVRSGEYWGVIEMGANFSVDLLKRFQNYSSADNATIQGGSVHVYLDMTNSQIAISLQQKLLEAFQNFTQKLLPNPQIAEIPVVFEPPIYGSTRTKFVDFAAPGIILTIIFFLAMGVTALSLVTERKEGLLDRSWVAGVSSTEVMLAHILVTGLLTIIQIILVLVFILAVFKIPNEGSLALITLLCILQGFCGQAFGLFSSSVCSTEITVMQFTQGFFYPIILMSGIIWPIQSMPDVLYYISLCLPQTYANEGLRNILSKGWGMEHFEVWLGYVITLAWSLVFLTLSAVFLRIRK
ncbi:ABC transporter G family member 20-like isoform X2 [Acanthaster planci]|nr:ABC transporter G family member 20-like isoform X2 [Acanthaster planci]XP_022100025.1 ABC transporter G family member 20-like isoform X2 [Acanthaster planci]XP_022100026.1 ABC transporter G family member 20-like isoform X2 [Acanthaster planci]XP_022100027.1 ABC transporter G family member 20-like isoform X2 [Acanthaster planci]